MESRGLYLFDLEILEKCFHNLAKKIVTLISVYNSRATESADDSLCQSYCDSNGIDIFQRYCIKIFSSH